MNIGDTVKLNREITTFSHGQGFVSYDEVGVIRAIMGDEVIVDFPHCSGWRGKLNEIVKFEQFCEDCEESVLRFYNVYDENHNVARRVCEDCLDDYTQCYRCDDYFINDAIHYDDEEDVYFCEHCWEETHNTHRVFGYHEFRKWKFFKLEKEDKPYYIGKEIELEPSRSSNTDKMLDAIEKINAVGMHDGSLRSGGIEVVTHPESWKYLLENKNKYKQFFKEVGELGYKDCGGCGLHFHVTRPNDNVISRVIVILESFKNEIKKLSRRNGDFHWSRFLTDGVNDKQKQNFTSTKYLKDNYVKNTHDRYLALNLNNQKTIEFRFFNGANNFEEFWGALQFIHNVIEEASKERKKISKINWQDLMKGKELKAQAQKQGVLNVNKFARDTTDILEKYEKAMKKLKKDMRKVLKNMAICVNREISNINLKSVKTISLSQMNQKINDFNRDFKYKTNYLQRIIGLHNALESNIFNFQNIKDYVNTTKSSYPVNTKRYEKFDKEITDLLNKFESEVR